MPYQPPFNLTHPMLSLVADIAELIGIWNTAQGGELVPQLRRGNRIKTIQASLAIEQNTLTLEQVTAVLDGKTVLGPPKDVQEVKNAFAAYDAMPGWQPHKQADLLAAHNILLHGLADDAGRIRSSDVGVYQGKRLVHMAPPAGRVPLLLTQLLDWLKNSDAHPLIASCAFHYEFEFIHPFSDGNGRMGRLWQTLILSKWQPALAYLPVESLIKHQQADYYRLLNQADKTADCSEFIVFLLESIKTALLQAIQTEQSTLSKTLVKTQAKTPVKILELLSAQPELTLAEIAIHIGKSVSAVERAAAKLQREGKLKFIGPRKGGHWQVL
ncbi:Fic family protein [Rheinheimera nanhaiensis]|uniref:Filamentation induced by cAMP protein fic n=1 Tax=Rheinheimera nanhaiensis E407-8 TaxID=562729 RepID=I1DXJ7_9GAMM|nr:Fic family protein [Rheinheimera nanhaiensis]GAB58775.1 filamentation induced by cAMP protein fic [Rheinheimera nanhaiensis E407-8]